MDGAPPTRVGAGAFAGLVSCTLVMVPAMACGSVVATNPAAVVSDCLMNLRLLLACMVIFVG
jgi:putative methionine-R-sulfoxide reductase with GAF domain